mgnify:CR=1 FL=1
MADTKISIYSPLDHVPEDIWLKIFTVVTHAPLPSTPPAAGLLPPPFTLASICTSLRYTVLSSTLLWRTITMHFSELFPAAHRNPRAPAARDRFQRQIEAFELWLARSGTQPLTLSIHLPVHEFSYHTTPAKRIPTLIAAQAARIRFLRMDMFEEWVPFFQADEEDTTPSLFGKVLQEVDMVTWSSKAPLDLSRCTNLTEAKFNVVCSRAGLRASLFLPWTRLVCATISRAPRHEILSLLQRMPNLQRCTLELIDLASLGPKALPDRMERPALTHLTVHGAQAEDLKAILDSIPYTLEHLSLGSLLDHIPSYPIEERAVEDPISFVDVLVQSLRAFEDTLHSLDLQWYNLMKWEGVRTLLLQMPRLKELKVSQGHVARDFDTGFLRGCLSDLEVLPALEHLEVLVGGKCMGPAEKDIIGFLRARSGANSALKRVDWIFECGEGGAKRSLKVSVRDKIKEILDGGLEFRMCSKTECDKVMEVI